MKKLLDTAIVEGIVTIIEINKTRFEIENNDLDIMVHCNNEQLTNLKKGMLVRIVGKCFTGGIIAEHLEVCNNDQKYI